MGNRSESEPDRAGTFELIGLVVLFCIVFVLTAPDYATLIRDPDIGSQLSKGQQILFGRHPWLHVDSSVYGPAIFYLSALAQLAGDERLVEVVIILAGYLVSYMLLFQTFKERSGSRGLLAVFCLLAVLAMPRFHKYHVLLPQAVFLFGLHRAWVARGAVRAASRLGVTSAIAGLFRLDFGAYAVLAALLFLILRYGPSGWRTVGRAVTCFLGAGFLVTSPWLGFLVLRGDPVKILSTSFETGKGVLTGLEKPLPSYQAELSPFVGVNALILLYVFFKLMPFLVAGVALVHGWLSTRQTAVSEQRATPLVASPDLYLLVAAIFAILVYLQAGHRIDISHVRQSLPSGLFVFFLAVGRYWRLVPKPGTAARRAALLIVGGLTVFLAVVLVPRPLLEVRTWSWTRCRDVLVSWTLHRSTGLEKAADKRSQLARVLLRVREMTAPGDAILVLPYFPQAYYFTERHFEAFHGWWNPGRFHAEGSEERYIRGLATTRFIVDHPAFSFDGMPERNARAYASGVIRHVYTSYGIVEVSGGFVLLSRDPLVWEEHGRYVMSLEATREPKALEATHSSNGCGPSGYAVSHVNTLPVAMGDAYSMPWGAGLLLTARECDRRSGPRTCSELALQRDGKLFRLRGDGQRVPIRKLGHMAVDTRSVPPGTYRLVEVSCPDLSGRNPGFFMVTDISITMKQEAGSSE